jgi:hypothetical protein
MFGAPTPSTYYWYLDNDTAVVEVENALNMSFQLHLWEHEGDFQGRLEYTDDVDFGHPLHDILIGRVWCDS